MRRDRRYIDEGRGQQGQRAKRRQTTPPPPSPLPPSVGNTHTAVYLVDMVGVPSYRSLTRRPRRSSCTNTRFLWPWRRPTGETALRYIEDGGRRSGKVRKRMMELLENTKHNPCMLIFRLRSVSICLTGTESWPYVLVVLSCGSTCS